MTSAGQPALASALYLSLVLVAIALALVERVHSLRNERRLRAEGVPEVAPWVFALMVPVYALIFIAALAEHFGLRRRPAAAWMIATVILLAASKLLKLWVILRLGHRWTMRVFRPENLKVETSGPYRYVRHPNYLAVLGEVAAVPLAGGAWITALAGVSAFSVILAYRIRTEEEALMQLPEYVAAMSAKGRFLPGGRI